MDIIAITLDPDQCEARIHNEEVSISQYLGSSVKWIIIIIIIM